MKKQIILSFLLITIFSGNAQSNKQQFFANMNAIIKNAEGKKIDYSYIEKNIRKVKSQIFTDENFINKEINVSEFGEHTNKYSNIDWNTYLEFEIIPGYPSKDLCSFKIYFKSRIIHEYGVGVFQTESLNYVRFYCL